MATGNSTTLLGDRKREGINTNTSNIAVDKWFTSCEQNDTWLVTNGSVKMLK
jgi:hypothetical protein